jgi:hypothetical protein
MKEENRSRDSKTFSDKKSVRRSHSRGLHKRHENEQFVFIFFLVILIFIVQGIS